MYLGKDPECGIDEGLRAAVTCLSIDVALKQGTVFDLTETWQNLDNEFKQ
jgi:hypothetical protein